MQQGRQPRDEIGHYEFGGFRLDVMRRRLLGQDGRCIPLRPKVFDTLLYFIQHQGELLDKSTLLQAVWGGIVVDENGLNQHVSMLRRIFGEEPGDNRFIVTVPGRGYRFVASLGPPQRKSARDSAWTYLANSLSITTPSEREVVLSRVIAASRERAFKAWTTPDMLRRWYGLPGWSMVVCELDLRAGRPWRFVTRHVDGTEVVQRGVIQEVVWPERLVQLEQWGNSNVGETLVTTTFVEEGGKTTFTIRVLFLTQEARDGFLESGLTRDLRLLYGQFAKLAETLD